MIKLKFIWQQIIIFAIIASIANVYAFEYWCQVRLTHQSFHVTGKHDHSKGHTHGSKAKQEGHQEHGNTEHHDSKETGTGCCKEETASFFASLQASGTPTFHFAPASVNALLPIWLEGLGFPLPDGTSYLSGFFPDVGLIPKLPDIRIYICSLTI